MRWNPGDHHSNLDEAIDHLLSSGGKRIRPTLVLLTGEMLDADPDRTVTLAAAIEMLHTATLVHDDLIDEATVRRGIPTLNARWTAGATVLTGDYIFARAAHLAARTGSLPVMERFAETLMTIVNGEITQLFGDRASASLEDYYDRIYSKTASLFELATQGAALLAEVDEDTARHIQRFGYSIGVAFQIVDDVLDFTGDQDQVGKPVANDLRQHILTLPTLLYLEKVDGQDEELQALLDGEELDEGTFERLVNHIRASGAVDEAMEEAREVAAQGREHLTSMPPGARRDALGELAHYVVRRTI